MSAYQKYIDELAGTLNSWVGELYGKAQMLELNGAIECAKETRILAKKCWELREKILAGLV